MASCQGFARRAVLLLAVALALINVSNAHSLPQGAAGHRETRFVKAVGR